MLWLIIAIILMSICLYILGYCTAKLDSFALNRDLADEYQRGHAWGLIHAIKIIQESNMF